MSNGFVAFPCPNDGCVEGVIEVCNAWGDDPLTSVKEPCDVCKGNGFIVVSQPEVISTFN